jgi:hypothetical protein
MEDVSIDTEDDFIDMEDDPKMTLSMWEMTVSIRDILSLCLLDEQRDHRRLRLSHLPVVELHPAQDELARAQRVAAPHRGPRHRVQRDVLRAGAYTR